MKFAGNERNLQRNEIKILDEKLKLYERTFGDCFPTFMFMHMTQEKCVTLLIPVFVKTTMFMKWAS